MKKNELSVLALAIVTVLFFYAWAAQAMPDLNKLSERQINDVKDLLSKLAPLIDARGKEGTLPTMTFGELYAPLNKKERSILKVFEHLPARKIGVRIPFHGMASGVKGLILIKGQQIKLKDEPEAKTIDTQFLPFETYDDYQVMMDAMEKDIGKRLYVESGYRGSAYQLYLFVYYLKNHGYSIRETVKYVALPGYSEHGAPKHQAIDFINKDGINGEYNTKEFEDLPEYKWLLKNAGRFGFTLSYPKDAGDGITYEPWHWRHESK